MVAQNAEINLDHCTRPADLFSHEIYDLFVSDCARLLNRSFGGHHDSRIKQLEFVANASTKQFTEEGEG